MGRVADVTMDSASSKIRTQTRQIPKLFPDAESSDSESDGTVETDAERGEHTAVR